MTFRVGYYGGVVQLDDQDIMYSQLGGYMCYAPKSKLELNCKICNKPLDLIFQFVSSKCEDEQHKVVYLLICDSDHYHESVKVLSWQGPLPIVVEEKIEEETIKFDENVDLLNLVSDLSSKKPEQIQNSSKQQRIYCQKRKAKLCPAYDIHTQEQDDLIEQLSEKNGNFVDIFNQVFKNAIYVVSDFQICEQVCKLKMSQNDFKQQEWEDPEYSNSDEQDEVIPMKQVDLTPCTCEYCINFDEKYEHEFDLFSGAVWPLKLQKAEFKGIYVFTEKNQQDGWQDGVGFVLKDEDDVQALLKHAK